MISIIAAIDNNGAIGKQGDLLCHLPADLRHFKEVTMGHPIVMGSRTFLSFPRRPLPGRRNIVITRQTGDLPQFEGAAVVHSLDEALATGRETPVSGDICIIGGGTIYEQAMARRDEAGRSIVDRIYLTQIHHSFEGADTWFPKIDPTEWKITEMEEHEADEKNPYAFSFVTLERKQETGGR